MTVNRRSWKELYQTGDTQPKIDGAEFMALSGTQSPFDLDSVDVDAINAITTRTVKDGQDNFVALLGNTGLGYHAPPGAKMKIRDEEMIFTPETLHNQAVYFAPDQTLTPPVQIHGIAIQCSGYFRLFVPETAVIGEPFSAIELDEGHNTGIVDGGRVYPPGGYIFHLDGSAPVGFDMQDRYELGGGVKLDQPSGYKALYIELYRTPVPDLYMALYSGENTQVVNLDNTSEAPMDDASTLQSQEILTVDRLRTILINIFSAAGKDPTGEGYVYLPWKYERWYKKDQGTPDWNLGSVDVAKLNAAPRTTNPATNLDNYVGVFATAPRPNMLLSPKLDLYAAADVALYSGKADDGSPVVGIRLEATNPQPKTITVLSGDKGVYGVVDVAIHANTPFSFRFTSPDNPTETVGLKVVRAFDPMQKNTILLIDGANYALDDSLFPRGDYIFRAYEKAGFILSVLSSTTLKDALPIPGASVEITQLRQVSGRDYYNAWFETAGVPKIVNSVDPKDQPETLVGLIQSEPAELEDVEELESLLSSEVKRLEALINNFSIWKVETWLGYAYRARPFVGTDVASGSKIDLGNGVTAQSFSQGKESFKIVNGGLLYTDTNGIVSNKSLLLQQSTAPFMGQIQIKPSHPFKLLFYKPNDPSNTPNPYDANNIIIINTAGKTITDVPTATGTLLPGQYTIRLNVPTNISLDYRPLRPLPKGAQFTIEVTGPGIGTPAPFSVVWGLDGKIRSVVNVNNVNERRPDTAGMTLVPTLIGEEVTNEDGVSVDDLSSDLRSQMDSWERSAGYQDLGVLSGAVNVDWSKGKYRRAITLGGDVTINLPNPPPDPQFLEIMVMRGDKTGKVIGVKSPQQGGTFTIADGDQPQSGATTHIRLFWDGKRYYKDVDSF